MTGELRGIEEAFGSDSYVRNDDLSPVEIIKTEADRCPSFKWRPGFRIGADFLFDCFDVNLDWTYFPGRAFYNTDAQHYGDWRLFYNAIDLKIGYKFYPHARFYVKPFIGLRGTKIHQSLHSYRETPQTDDHETTILTFDMHNKEKHWLLGPQVGVEANWSLGWNFSLYSTIDIVNYCGRDHINYQRIDNTPEDVDAHNPETVQTNIWNKKARFNNFALDDSLGIRWDKYLCHSHCDIHFNVKLGLEQHRVYNLSNLVSSGQGSLSIDGGLLEGALGFRF